MKEFEVIITETLQRKVKVKASDEKGAREKYLICTITRKSF